MSLQEWSDTDLNEQLERNKQSLKWHTDCAKDDQKNISAYQAELDRRQLAAYWQQHKELEPVQVGDKVVITEGIFNSELAKVYCVGDIVEIISINVAVMYFHISGTWGQFSFTVDEIQKMRRAYLATQQPATEANEGG